MIAPFSAGFEYTNGKALCVVIKITKRPAMLQRMPPVASAVSLMLLAKSKINRTGAF